MKKRDGLERGAWDSLNASYEDLLEERHDLLKSIDQCKSNIGKDYYVSPTKA